MSSPPITATILPKLTSCETVARLLGLVPTVALAAALPVAVPSFPTLTLPVAVLVPVEVVNAEDATVEFAAVVVLPLIAPGPCEPVAV